MNERWLPIKDHPGYEISDHGRVRSLDRWSEFERKGALVRRFIRGVLRKPGISRDDGYQYVPLTNRQNCYVHRLVALHFVEGDHSLTVNHDDGVKTNNHYLNLVWATQGANNEHRFRVLNKVCQHRVPVTVDGTPYISQQHAADALGVHVGQISSARRRKHRLHGKVVA